MALKEEIEEQEKNKIRLNRKAFRCLKINFARSYEWSFLRKTKITLPT